MTAGKLCTVTPLCMFMQEMASGRRTSCKTRSQRMMPITFGLSAFVKVGIRSGGSRGVRRSKIVSSNKRPVLAPPCGAATGRCLGGQEAVHAGSGAVDFRGMVLDCARDHPCGLRFVLLGRHELPLPVYVNGGQQPSEPAG